MYSQAGAMAAAPQKPETFMLSTEAQQALPHDAQVALQQVDNRMLISDALRRVYPRTFNLSIPNPDPNCPALPDPSLWCGSAVHPSVTNTSA